MRIECRDAGWEGKWGWYGGGLGGAGGGFWGNRSSDQKASLK